MEKSEENRSEYVISFWVMIILYSWQQFFFKSKEKWFCFKVTKMEKKKKKVTKMNRQQENGKMSAKTTKFKGLLSFLYKEIHTNWYKHIKPQRNV